MNLMNKIPREFYKLFASKYMDYYQQFLTAIYEESGRSFSLLGLTEGECRAVMNERIAETTLDWSEEQFVDTLEYGIDLSEASRGLGMAEAGLR